MTRTHHDRDDHYHDQDNQYNHDEEEAWIEADGDDGEDNDGGLTGDLFDDPDPTCEFSLEFGSHLVRLTGVKEENGQTLNSTGLTLWRASSSLCDHLVYHYGNDSDTATLPSWSSSFVLELGAGLGLCGVLAHKLGARLVVLTDGDTETLRLTRANVRANIDANDDGAVVVECRQLRWGRRLDEFSEWWQRRRRRLEKIDNNEFKDENDGRFDVVMGSDIIYLEEVVEPLFRTVSRLLSNAPGARFLLAFARRNVSIDIVLDEAKSRGFEWTEPEGTTGEGVYVFTRRRP